MTKLPIWVLHILALPILPVCLLILLLLWIFRQLVGIWLKNKFGNKFGGLLISGDKAFASKYDKSRKITLAVLYVRSEKPKNIIQDIRQLLTEKVYNQPSKYPKLSSTCHSALGQEYLLKDQVEVSDIIKILPIPPAGIDFDEQYLKTVLGRISNNPLPKNNTALWEVSLTNQPLCNSNIKGYVYPLIIRFNHITADGIRLVEFMSNLFSYSAKINYSDKLITDGSEAQSTLTKFVNISKKTLYLSYLALIAPVTILQFLFLKEHDQNAIHQSKLSGEKLMAWAAETDSRHVNTVKEIKNSIPNTRFSHIVLACISASFFSYFKKKHFVIPSKISCLIPIIFSLTTKERSELKNNFAFGGLELPVINPAKFLDGLKNVKSGVQKMRNNPEKNISYLTMNYLCAPTPTPLIDMLFNTSAYTCSISIVPATARIKMSENCEIIAVFPSAPHTNNTGMTFTVCTYDDKFHVGLFVDKAVISEQEDIQFIVDEFMRNINALSDIIETKFNKAAC